MKNNVDNGVAIFLISLLIMPIITMISLLVLQNQMLATMDILSISNSTFSNVFIGEIIWFITAWVTLFISYLFHVGGIKGVQTIVCVSAFIFIIVSICTSMNLYTSISHILNPVIVFISSGYSIINPNKKVMVDKKVIDKEKNNNENEVNVVKDDKKKSSTPVKKRKTPTKKTNTNKNSKKK